MARTLRSLWKKQFCYAQQITMVKSTQKSRRSSLSHSLSFSVQCLKITLFWNQQVCLIPKLTSPNLISIFHLGSKLLNSENDYLYRILDFRTFQDCIFIKWDIFRWFPTTVLTYLYWVINPIINCGFIIRRKPKSSISFTLWWKLLIGNCGFCQ